MPEGPSIVLLKEEVIRFTGMPIIEVSGNSKIDQPRLLSKQISFNSWGKHFLICFDDFYVRVHFLMFGSYLINDKKDQAVRLHLGFENGEINLYACSIKILEGNPESLYDWSADVMNDAWSEQHALAKLKKSGNKLICDELLNQDIFSGVGNIIKNEILYIARVHPESVVEKIPSTKMNRLLAESRAYSFRFLEWKRNHELKKHWLAHTKQICTRCDLPILKKYTGVRNRRSFFCPNCQNTYT